jgi:predicted transposase YdaD
MGEYDVTTKHLIESRPRDWLALAGLHVPPAAAVSVVDADLSTLTSMADKLIRVDDANGSYLVHVEFQSGFDANPDLRVLLYNVLARWRHRIPVRSIVFLLRSEAESPGSTVRFLEGAFEGSRLEFSYELVRVWELPVESVLGGGIGTLPVAPICDLRSTDLPQVVDQMRRRLESEPSLADAGDLWTAAKILMGLRFEEDTINALLLGVLAMKESVIYQSIKREGRVEGRVEGIVEGELRTLILQGTRRFGQPDPAALDHLKSIKDVARLDELSLGLLTASGWDDLLG